MKILIIGIVLLLSAHTLSSQSYINIQNKQGSSQFSLVNTTLKFDSSGNLSVWENREAPSALFSVTDLRHIGFSAVTTAITSEEIPSTALRFYQSNGRLIPEQSGHSSLLIYNMYGQQVVHVDNIQADGVDISSLAKGLYVVSQSGRSATFVK